MKPYWFDPFSGRLEFHAQSSSRNRAPRARAQKLYARLGGRPFLPFRVAHYQTPSFYYSDMMWHRRKFDLDYGVSKVQFGTRRAAEVGRVMG